MGFIHSGVFDVGPYFEGNGGGFFVKVQVLDPDREPGLVLVATQFSIPEQ